ncbi:FxLYD domain-containing protein [Dehalobacter sp. TeCB1]|uniref:FxLYD domain-containing protein n=1 Tax=Dehalobacter sp. TeCB1 TaxID=1843715 RepID=UPI00083AFF1B|nr:FxLYD domain-containing protein [Dehalobacter sp. TeCB1]OCZ49730.1 hypothetical protein A7D23_02560 [Dehalobacter sp. TeCB1]
MKIKTALILLIVVFVLAGCSKYTSTQSNSSSQSNQQNITQNDLENIAKIAKANAESYKQYLSIHDIKINDYTDTGGDIYVEGYIKNNGDKTIKHILVTVYYLDKNGEAISEDSSLSTVEDNSDSLIKPNYESSFIFEVPEGIKKSWDKKVKVEIIGIEFEE